MTPNEKQELIALLEERDRRKSGRRIELYYPEMGPLRREAYPKHMQFFAAGQTHVERLFLAANRVGKTEGAGGYEMVTHLTGDYKPWWPGKKFTRAIDAWAGGDTSETVRDIIQLKLCGNFGKGELGTGLIPREKIVDYTKGKGIADSLDSIYLRHASGGVSQLSFKTYAQGRTSWQGTKKDLIWLDEEPPLDIYTEALLRTTDTTGKDTEQGLMMLTFTPLLGMSETVMSFLPNGQLAEHEDGSKFVVMASWDDVPHLSQKTRDMLWKAIPPFQRDARSKGIPQLGAGAIYPVPETDVMVDDFKIPEHWVYGYSMDVGWNRTSAGIWRLDREQDVLYRVGEHYRGEAEPSVHATGINARLKWRQPGVIDPAANGRSQIDGQKLMQKYIDLGLDLHSAANAVEAGILDVWERLSSGRLKVFKSCQNWLTEFRLYRRDEKGKVVKVNDHAMDDTRYMVLSGIKLMKAKPSDIKKQLRPPRGGSDSGWMGS